LFVAIATENEFSGTVLLIIKLSSSKLHLYEVSTFVSIYLLWSVLRRRWQMATASHRN